MPQNKIRILNAEPLNYCAEARAILGSFATVTYSELSRAELLENIREYDALIVRLGHKIDEEILASGTNLKAVATAATGLNHIDEQEAARRKIEVLSLRGETGFLETITATAELAWGLLLSLARNIPSAARSVSDGRRWDRDSFRGSELHGKTLGVIGLGRLGSKAASFGLAFGMRVIATDISPVSLAGVETVSLDKLLEQSDFISIHIPYNNETANLIGAKELNKLKQTCYLINTSRGEVIDETQLLRALETNILAGAALDVLSGENDAARPGWPQNDALIDFSKKHPQKLIITPHIGGCTLDSMQKTEVFMAEKLKRFFAKR